MGRLLRRAGHGTNLTHVCDTVGGAPTVQVNASAPPKQYIFYESTLAHLLLRPKHVARSSSAKFVTMLYLAPRMLSLYAGLWYLYV